MNLSRELLQRYSDETGYAVGPLEKVARLGEFASNVSRHPLLADVLALKGGTALNLGFGLPTRLSVDLDYNYIGHLDRQRMLEDRPRVEEALARVPSSVYFRLDPAGAGVHGTFPR